MAKVFEEIEEVEVLAPIEVTVKSESVEVLDISTRAYNALKKADINTIDELSKYTIEEIEKLDNIGKKTASEIEKKIKNKGFEFSK